MVEYAAKRHGIDHALQPCESVPKYSIGLCLSSLLLSKVAGVVFIRVLVVVVLYPLM